jgi:hypothetical protein
MTESIIFLYPKKAKVHGLQQDAVLLESCLDMKRPIRHADPLEPPVQCDMAVHFEIPIYGWMPWASINVLVVNPEWWEDAWAPYLQRMNSLIFKCSSDRDTFLALYPSLKNVKILTLPWTSAVTADSFKTFPNDAEKGCLWMLGASTNKREAAEHIVPLWKEEWPPLMIYTKDPLSVKVNQSNITINLTDLEDDLTRRKIQSKYPCHLIFSAAESLSLVAHEGRAAGAYLIGNSLPTYKEAFQDKVGVYLTESTLIPEKAGQKDTFAEIDLEKAINAYLDADKHRNLIRASSRDSSIKRFKEFKSSVGQIRELFTLMPLHVDKRLPPLCKELPSISIVTLLYNRRKFTELAFHNLLSTDYPKDKIEWVVVEDSDIQDEQASDKIIKFGRQASPMSVSYIPLQKKTPIGEKRNIAIERAQHDIILMMDDDDHYPVTSFRRRVSWLLDHMWKPNATVCTTIACYDLLKGTSAVNSPPFALPLKQRVSEATLTFKKSWWEAQRFSLLDMGEGESFLAGREDEVLEVPPQQIIVAMTHNTNASSRRLPPTDSGKPSCFWGFPPEFLTFLHGLVGVEIDT